VGSPPAAPDFPADPSQYNSQYLQDVLLDRWVFRGLSNGIFADIGAHDGVTYSNSYFFEKFRGWRGVAIEPNPDVFKKLTENRQCDALNCCVSERPGTVPFLKLTGYSEMLSGIADNYDPEHRLRVETELRQFGGKAETIEVEARPFQDIAREFGLAEITYLSIDTEGSELSILRGIDFSRLFVHALTVEYNFEHAKTGMIALMRERGFEHVQTLGHDLLFLNRSSPFYEGFTRLCRD
jgi:FkbM family methyltransferase